MGFTGRRVCPAGCGHGKLTSEVTSHYSRSAGFPANHRHMSTLKYFADTTVGTENTHIWG